MSSALTKPSWSASPASESKRLINVFSSEQLLSPASDSMAARSSRFETTPRSNVPGKPRQLRGSGLLGAQATRGCLGAPSAWPEVAGVRSLLARFAGAVPRGAAGRRDGCAGRDGWRDVGREQAFRGHWHQDEQHGVPQDRGEEEEAPDGVRAENRARQGKVQDDGKTALPQ